jgi:hypothetical protein
MSLTTGGLIGPIEMISATAGCGVFYAATAGQPLTIIGSTGPVLAFTAVLYKLAARMSLPFLPLYAWVGLWTSAMLGASALFSLSNIVGYIIACQRGEHFSGHRLTFYFKFCLL